MQFPKMDDTGFPYVENVNVNQWKNDFDYSRYDYTQMNITICAVPWDMGEAHVGNRTISGIGNVVWFETKEKRDAWFDAIPDSECFRFESKYKELHRDHFIDVPLPFDVAAKYNYLVVEYSMFANDDSPVMYEDPAGVRRWFWFVREVEYLAPNTTRLHILDDAFQTWMYDVRISGMMLERGHAPMFETDVKRYLENPVANSENLLAEDVNFGNVPNISKKSNELILNAGNMYALIFTTADVFATWGTKQGGNWKTPGLKSNVMQGIPSYFAFAIPASDMQTFVSNATASVPQFLQTVKTVAFVSADLLTLGDSFTFAGITCYRVNANYKSNNLIERFNEDDFAYDWRYDKIAKLYTYPYAYVEVSDENGNVTEIHIEDTNGYIEFRSNVNLVFPWLNITGHIQGIGRSASKSITFANVTQRNMPIQGNWYEHLQQWNIPTYGIYQDAGTNNDYATYYDRVQNVNDYTTVLNNENASADTTVSNADLQIAANDAITATSNTASQTDTDAVQSYNIATQAWQAGASRASANNQIVAAEQSAAVAAGGNVVGSVASGAMSGGLVGAGLGLVSGIIGGVTTGLQTAITTNLTSTQTETQIGFSQAQLGETNQNSEDRIAIQIQATSDNNDTQNDYIEASTANNAATQKANAQRSANNAQAAINNRVAQSALNAPMEFGAYNNGDLATSRPIGLFANIVTQSNGAISQAGDEFLRYGYMYNKYWNFDGNWNIGKYFTYWKLSDFWVSNLNVPDMYMDRLRFFMLGGVTVWRKPEDIGKRNIYENFI